MPRTDSQAPRNPWQTSRMPHRSFGSTDLALDSDELHGSSKSYLERALEYVRELDLRFWRRKHVNDDGEEQPPIPTMMHPSAELYSTPLPILSMIVLSITMLGEFLSANVSTPFLLFMVKGFSKQTDESEVAFWTGILVSTFFLTQFLTSLLWATVAESHGRRSVLVVSLLGSAVTCLSFGTATTLQQAIVIRLMQGVFAGAVGVARGSVAFVTDPSNEGRAYAILGFCWGLGGVAGAIIGGSFERPAVKWPHIFGDFQLFIKYPYLLPCALAASITLTGSILACFLGPDGGPRQGAVQLPLEKLDVQEPILEEESSPPSPVFEDTPEQTTFARSIRKKISQKLSGYLTTRPAEPSTPISVSNSQPPVGLERTRTYSSRYNGSAYGYGTPAQRRLTNNAIAFRNRRESINSSIYRRRRTNPIRDSQTSEAGSELSFAQRLLMANENAVTNIADLWVAAAMNVDNEDPFESDGEDDVDSIVLDLDDEEEGEDGETRGRQEIRDDRERQGSHSSLLPRMHRLPARGLHRSTSHSLAGRGSPYPGSSDSPRRPSTSRPIPARKTSFNQPLDGTPTLRRFSTKEPAIFAHPGVKTPPAVLDAQQLLTQHEIEGPDPLEPILESRQSHSSRSEDLEAAMEKPPSIASQIPVLIIVQYGFLALHTTTHDQVFMSYLVSDFQAGGLNLNAGHFAQLIALMCLAQIAYQFYLYPNMGPPRGRFSHLAMFRIGSLLFIPSYLTVVLYRPLASAGDDNQSVLLMIGLSLSTALRYCAITFGYTSISILLNYMTPPAAVGFANGIAQSIVSLARCFGPVLGGYLWAVSIANNPAGYYLGFCACAAACGLSVLTSFFIR